MSDRDEADTRRGRVLVTGATSGIGLETACHLARSGWDVVAAGLNAGSVKAEAASLRFVELDVTDETATADLIGGLDELAGLVNCAGIILRGGQEFEIDGFRKVIEVNLVGTMRMCTLARPLLAQSRGAIVNAASMLSFFGGPFVPAYTASKGGIAQLTKALAVAWAQEGIRVNAVAPGWIATELTQALREDADRSAVLLGRTPMGRWGTPQDISQAVDFLLSPQAAFITGAVLPVDGGYAAA